MKYPRTKKRIMELAGITEAREWTNLEKVLKSFVRKDLIGPADVDSIIKDLSFGQPNNSREAEKIINNPDVEPLSRNETKQVIDAYFKDVKKSMKRPEVD